VVEGETGILFEHATSESLAAAILKFETYTWNQRKLRRHAEKFGDQAFATRFLEFLNSVAPGVLPQNGNNEISAPPLRSLVAKAS